MQTFALGQEIQHEDKAWLVIRIVTSTSLFEDGVKVEESYVEVRSATGVIDHITLYSREEPFTKTSVIKALPPVPWRKNAKV